MSTQEETVAIVDEANRVIGRAPRREMRAERLIYRATYILVLNSRHEVLLQKRTLTKDMYPGWYDPACGGVVLAGESYEECAARELAEELGIRAPAPTLLFDFFYTDITNRVWGRAYTCMNDGPFTLQASEIDCAFFCPLQDVLGSRYSPITPDGLFLLQRYVAQGFARPLQR